VTGSCFGCDNDLHLNFAALQLMTTLFLPNGFFAMLAAISRTVSIPKNKKPGHHC
jgi:hypothetical protein